MLNNSSEEQETTVTSYISEFVEKFKAMEQINKSELMASSIKNNIYLALIIWLAGTTIIGIPIVLGIILFRGFCLGYTVSAITLTLGTWKSLFLSSALLLLQNILLIPAVLTMGVSSIKLYKAIINDRRRENIKIEILRHTVISVIMLGLLILSSILESRVSILLLKFGIKYI